MAKAAKNDPVWVDFALEFWLGGDSWLSLNGLDTWCRTNYEYRGEAEEIVRTPEFMLTHRSPSGNIEGDCDDIATFTSAVLNTISIPCRLHAIQTQSDGDFDHVFSEVRIGEFWIPIDPTVEQGTEYRTFADLLEYV